MVKVIMGVKGTGKTKQMVETINAAVDNENGHIVCIEKGSKLVYDIKSSVRLVEASDYPMGGYSYLKGFVSGVSWHVITILHTSSLTACTRSLSATTHGDGSVPSVV